ncbi:unnamed protein product [Sphagnum jensenii]|uniref:Uncharacterized protein n=1 Tax=Sphagnum jensenii TaxID=128206 RepID=A0ABP1B8K9_9BRYO
MGSDGFLSGHADFNGGHPSLMKNAFEGVLVTEMPSAPFRPKVVEKKTIKDVKGWLRVSEAAGMVGVKLGGVVIAFDGNLPKQDERPGEGRVFGRFPCPRSS